MAKVIAAYRQLQEGKYLPHEVKFGDLSKPETVTTYKFKTDGNTPPECEVKDPEHLAHLIASGYEVEPSKGEKPEDLEPIKQEGQQIKAEATAKAKKEQDRLNRAAEAKRKLAQAKTKADPMSMGEV